MKILDPRQQLKLLYAAVSRSADGSLILATAAQRKAKSFDELKAAICQHYISLLTHFRDLLAPNSPDANKACDLTNRLLNSDKEQVVRTLISQHVPLALFPTFLNNDLPIKTKLKLLNEYQTYARNYGFANAQSAAHRPQVNQLSIMQPTGNQLAIVGPCGAAVHNRRHHRGS